MQIDYILGMSIFNLNSIKYSLVNPNDIFYICKKHQVLLSKFRWIDKIWIGRSNVWS